MIAWLRAKLFPAPADRDAIRKAAAIVLHDAQAEQAASRKARVRLIELELDVIRRRGTR